jgi:hypothetical protein
MSIPEIFLQALREMWWLACAGAVGLLIRFVGRLASSHCRTFYTRAKSFPELAALTKNDQQRLLREASREAFSALSFVPDLVFLAFWWGGFALARTLRTVTATSYWVEFVLTGLFIVLGHWLAERLEVHRVRPFLKKLIDGQSGKSVA